MTDIRVVIAEGDAATRGRQIGRGLGDLIERSLGFYHGYLERRGVSSPELQDLLAPYLAASERALPQYMTLIKAMAEGAMVPVWELFAVNAFEELEPELEPVDGVPLFLRRKDGSAPRDTERRSSPPPWMSHGSERCSTVTVAGPGTTLMAHNEHWLAGDVGNVAIVVEIPNDGPTIVSPTVVCCLPAVGMNHYGAAQGIGSLTARGDGPGVPRVFVSRRSLDAVDRGDAIRLATMPGRAGGYGHVFAFGGGDAFVVETTASSHAVLDGPQPHTNHYIDPELAEVGAEPSVSSLTRYRSLVAALAEGPPTTPEGMMALMKSHENSPDSVCLHPNEDEGEEASAVVFGMVCDLEASRMWVANGNPCTQPYNEVEVPATVGRA
jgi:isopenicillin-N N-acyltransferase like protein